MNYDTIGWIVSGGILLILYVSASNNRESEQRDNEPPIFYKEDIYRNQERFAKPKANNISSIISYGFLFAVIGLAIGYFIFGKVSITGEYISIDALLNLKNDENILVNVIANAIVEPIREKILVSGVVGGIVGIIINATRK